MQLPLFSQDGQKWLPSANSICTSVRRRSFSSSVSLSTSVAVSAGVVHAAISAAVDLDRAELAAAVRLEFRVVAEVRDVAPGRERRLHHGLARARTAPRRRRAGSVGRSFTVVSSRCAPASSRPVIWRARRERAVEVEGRREIERAQLALVGRAGSASACRGSGCRRCGRGRSGPTSAARGSAGRSRARSCCVPLPAWILSIAATSIEVPTRHGVQKPQLSCAKKCAKLRATSNMSRLSSNTVNAPAVGRSSKAMRRPNSFASTQTPDGPLICTACVSAAPQSSSTWRTVTPNGYS